MRKKSGSIAFLFATAVSAQASADHLQWGSTAETDYGYKASVALGNVLTSVSTPWEVQVHQSTSSLGELWYTSGQGALVNGGPAAHWGKYSNGAYPSVATFDQGNPSGANVIEVHQTTAGFGPLHSMFGTVYSTLTSWSGESEYDWGYHPAVASRDGIVVEVHQGTTGSGPLWAHVGSLRGSGGFTWNASAVQYDTGANPAISLSDVPGIGMVAVEVHQGAAGAGALWYRTGLVTVNGITWNNAYPYDTGYTPAITFRGSGLIEVHAAGPGAAALYSRTGRITWPTITWDAPFHYDTGAMPSIAYDGELGGAGLEIHQATTAATQPWIWTHAFTVNELPVPLFGQEQSNWCWAAVDQMVTTYFGRPISQCMDDMNEVAATSKKYWGSSYSGTCCGAAVGSFDDIHACNLGGACDFPGLNWQTSSEGTAMTFDQLTSEIAANRPVAFSWNWIHSSSASASGHVMVATGVHTVQTPYAGLESWVLVNDPDPVGSGTRVDMLYSAYVSGSTYTHQTDMYGFSTK